MSVAAALTMVIKPTIGAAPADMYTFAIAAAHEAVAGFLIGTSISLVLQAAMMAGAFLDLQIGLGLSQTLNPITGVPISLIAQFKYFLALVVFLSINAHHVMLGAFVHSYDSMPAPTMAMMPAIQTSFVELITRLSIMALQIAAPVMAVSIIVDASLGIINKAVPQMQTFMVGLPAKILMGLIALSIALPVLTTSVQFGVDSATDSLVAVFHKPLR